MPSLQMSQNSARDIAALKEWMAKEPHLPKDLEDSLLLSFLHSCHFSLEKTKKSIDQFCTTRAYMPEVYFNRDPLSSEMQTMFDNTLVSFYSFKKNSFFIHKYNDATLESFHFYDLMKHLSIVIDVWFKCYPSLVDNHYIIVDMEYTSMKMIPKMNILYFRNFLVYLLDSVPERVSKIICINVPSVYDKMYALVRPLLPIEIQNMIHPYTDYESMYQFIDKQYFPKEYGGEAQSIYERNHEWREKIQQERDFLLNDNLWMSDVKKKSKTSDNDGRYNSDEWIVQDSSY